MKEFIQHIENLLIKNDFVIIPDFGGFTLQNEPARISNTGITPPKTKIGFNSLLNNNDGLLTVAIVRSENVSSKEANKIVEQKLSYLNTQLRKKKKFQFGRLGNFYLTAEGQMIFSPAENFDFLPGNFGLKDLKIRQIEEKEEQELISIKFKPKNLLRYAAVFFILLGLLLTTPKLGYSESENYAGVQNPVAQFFASSSTTSAQQGETKVSIEDVDSRYHIIISNTEDQEAAYSYCNLLKAKHYANAAVLTNGTNYQVILESFSSPDVATLYIKKYCRNEDEFKNAWILYQALDEAEIDS